MQAAAASTQPVPDVVPTASLLSPRSDVLKVKELYQYPRADEAVSNETEVFSREPFIARFHSPTTRTTHNVRRITMTSENIKQNILNVQAEVFATDDAMVYICDSTHHQENREKNFTRLIALTEEI